MLFERGELRQLIDGIEGRRRLRVLLRRRRRVLRFGVLLRRLLSGLLVGLVRPPVGLAARHAVGDGGGRTGHYCRPGNTTHESWHRSGPFVFEWRFRPRRARRAAPPPRPGGGRRRRPGGAPPRASPPPTRGPPRFRK